ncbi:TraB family protein [Methanococcus vannielii SB]|jgi:pheromone shutdown-related protein TraB|uniref:TraB family protein n=1 Tax=Methanococcus vannielii (strain ATCC 35089 / DSM 1224 / JCM 13029 / OCM 148 / SB) TaxID=406327 RepID=A6URR3_METVS|nr:TraB/GumN family protein [Methanococcus vannielii]ABR55185.1 TraB family protein [Methanococcus vannielii SB]
MYISVNNGVTECEIRLVGTAHVSDDSIAYVENAIIEMDPELVAIELDKDRFISMLQNKKENVDLKAVIKQGKVGIFLIHSILANFQKNIGEQFGIKPGSEMKKATELAIQYQKPISLIDRPIGITLSRTVSKMSFKEKFRFLLGLLTEKNVELDEKAINEMVENAEDMILILKDISPSIYLTLVDERDKYMAKNIFEASKGKERILAVVGAGHLAGIKKYLKELESGHEIDIKELLEVKKNSNIMGKLVSIVILMIILYGFYSVSNNLEALKSLTFEWILINGVLSSLGVVLARGKLQTIIAAFLAAPITSLIPIIGAGYVAGLVELKFRDVAFEDISKMINTESFKELMSNQAMRVLLVAALANLGSTVGTLYFVPRFI